MLDALPFIFLLISSMFDVLTRKVPNLFIGITAVIGFAIALLPNSEIGIAYAVMGFILGLALFLPPFLIGAMGAADVKVFAVTGLYLGPSEIFSAFIYTLLSGGVLALLYWAIARFNGYSIGGWRVFDSHSGSKMHQKNKASQVTLPYVVAIFFGVLLSNLITNIHN